MTNTDICNMALSHIARGRILSIDDKTEEARQCKIHYNHLRRMLLREYNWGFAKRISMLSRLDADVPGWAYVYVYPEKCLAVRFLFNKSGAKVREFDRDKYDLFLVSDNVSAVGCDIDKAYLEYTYDAVDADLFTADFVEALSHLLASTLAVPLTANSSLQQMQYQLYQVGMAKAKVSMANERESDTNYPNSYIKARG